MTVTLDDIYKKHGEWLYLTDTRAIDLKLAIEVTRQMQLVEGGKPVWMIVVAPSGSAKSEFLETLQKGMPLTTYDLPMMTSKSLVTGYKGGTDHVLEMDKKLVIVTDASRITSLYGDKKHSVFSQLRDLYDGKAGQITGGERNAKYNNLKVTMLWGAVPAIEREIILTGELGTRFLMYFYEPPPSRNAMDMMLKRSAKKSIEQFKLETGELEAALCRNIERDRMWEAVQINDDVSNQLKGVAEHLATMRASCEINWQVGVPIGILTKEEPTRAFGQFMRLYRALMSLDADYKHERAMSIINQVAFSSGSRIRASVLKVIESNNPNVTTSDISEELRLAYVRVRPECYILWQMGILDKEEKVITDALGRDQVAEAWSIHQTPSLQVGLGEMVKHETGQSLQKN
jgi:hypothetical protein